MGLFPSGPFYMHCYKHTHTILKTKTESCQIIVFQLALFYFLIYQRQYFYLMCRTATQSFNACPGFHLMDEKQFLKQFPLTNVYDVYI